MQIHNMRVGLLDMNKMWAVMIVMDIHPSWSMLLWPQYCVVKYWCRFSAPLALSVSIVKKTVGS